MGNFVLSIKSNNNIFQIKILTMFYYFDKAVFFIIKFETINIFFAFLLKAAQMIFKRKNIKN